MRIESIEIANFKNLRHFRLDRLPQLVVLAGPNGSGKTAVFEALRIFKESVAATPYSMSSNPGPADLLAKLGPIITTGEGRATVTATISMTEEERVALDMSRERYGTGIFTVAVSIVRDNYGQERVLETPPYYAGHTSLQDLFGSFPLRGDVVSVIDHIPPDRSFSMDTPRDITFSFEHRRAQLQGLVAESETKFDGLLSDLVRMRLIDMQQRGRRDRRRYMERVGDIFRHFLPNKEFLGVEFPEELDRPPSILVRSGRQTHDIRRLSSGEREILMTYMYLEKLAHQGSVILFDEPELHLHPTLQRRVVEYLRSYVDRGRNQVWLITHSEEIVGTAEYESLFAMTGSGRPAVVPVRERAERTKLLRDLGASVGLQLASPRILFLEGDSDAELLPMLFDPLPTGLSLVDTGGKGNLMSLRPAAMKLLDEVIAEGRFYFVRDRDVEENPDTLDELEEKHKGYFFAWDRYHIENYLLEEDAIYRVLAEDPDVPSPTSSAEVGRQLREIADERRDDVLAKHIEARLNRELRKRLVINAREGVRASLLKATGGRLQRTNDLLDPIAVEGLYAEVDRWLAGHWNSEWKHLCVGRDVLRSYHKRYVAHYYGYEVFRNKVARKMRELDRVPEAMTRVMGSVIAGLANPPVMQGETP